MQREIWDMRFLTVGLLPVVMVLGRFSEAGLPECPQEVQRQTKSAVVLRALAAQTADSVGWIGQEQTVTVLECARDWCLVSTTLNRGYLPDTLLSPATKITAAPVTPPATTSPPATAPPTRQCCKICRTGKACGNTCIARNKTCRQPPGCPCNGGDGPDR